MTASSPISKAFRVRARPGDFVAGPRTLKLVLGLPKFLAEELLDSLEAKNQQQVGVSYLPESGFAVWHR